MEDWIDRILSEREPKRKRFLVQTGNEKMTGIFLRDGKESYETNVVPTFNNFIQVICNSEYDCRQMLALQGINYKAIHEVIHPLKIDGIELDKNLFTSLMPNLYN